jgi:hypothetical protein
MTLNSTIAPQSASIPARRNAGWIQLPLPLESEGLRAFRLSHPIYQDGKRYTHRIRWFLAEMSVVGLHREEVARSIGEALRNHEPYKYTRSKIRGVADLIIHVLPGAYDQIVTGPDMIAAIITPKTIPTLHHLILTALKETEKPLPLQ